MNLESLYLYLFLQVYYFYSTMIYIYYFYSTVVHIKLKKVAKTYVPLEARTFKTKMVSISEDTK